MSEREGTIFTIDASNPANAMIQQAFRESVQGQLTREKVDAVILLVASSGAFPTQGKNGGVVRSYLNKSREEGIPVFVVPDAPQPQVFPWHATVAQELGGTPLENSCRANLSEVGTVILKSLKSAKDTVEVVNIVSSHFKQHHLPQHLFQPKRVQAF